MSYRVNGILVSRMYLFYLLDKYVEHTIIF